MVSESSELALASCFLADVMTVIRMSHTYERTGAIRRYGRSVDNESKNGMSSHVAFCTKLLSFVIGMTETVLVKVYLLQ